MRVVRVAEDPVAALSGPPRGRLIPAATRLRLVRAPFELFLDPSLADAIHEAPEAFAPRPRVGKALPADDREPPVASSIRVESEIEALDVLEAARVLAVDPRPIQEDDAPVL